MCGPLAVAGAGAALSIASSAAQYAGQSQMASQEQSAINTNLTSQYAQGQQQLVALLQPYYAPGSNLGPDDFARTVKANPNAFSPSTIREEMQYLSNREQRGIFTDRAVAPLIGRAFDETNPDNLLKQFQNPADKINFQIGFNKALAQWDADNPNAPATERLDAFQRILDQQTKLFHATNGAAATQATPTPVATLTINHPAASPQQTAAPQQPLPDKPADSTPTGIDEFSGQQQ